MDSGDSNGSNFKTNVGLPVSRVAYYSSLHRLGRRFQLLCPRDFGDSRADRRCGEELSTDSDARGRSAVVELSFLALPGDCDVDRV